MMETEVGKGTRRILARVFKLIVDKYTGEVTLHYNQGGIRAITEKICRKPDDLPDPQDVENLT
jgi:hypothetical protein